MLIDFEDTKSISHKPTKGRARESIVIEQFLKPYLPKRYSVGSGIIIDRNNKESLQQDLVIYDDFYSPLLQDLQSDKLFFPESVFSVIESKSTLDKSGVNDMFEKSSSVTRLTATFKPKISIAPNLIIDSVRIPVLCMGLAFTATKSIDKLRDDFREIKNQNKNTNSLSLICVLKDKDDRAGIILHVNELGLDNIDIIPLNNSRLAVLEFDDSGGALLYTYLILMEHLKNSGIVSPTPDYVKYAEVAGLTKSKISVANEDTKRAKIQAGDHFVETDSAILMKNLTEKLFTKGLDDTEKIEYYYHMVKISGESVLNNTLFFIENKMLNFATPRSLYTAIINYKNQSPSDNDIKMIEEYKKIIQRVGNKEITLTIKGP